MSMLVVIRRGWASGRRHSLFRLAGKQWTMPCGAATRFRSLAFRRLAGRPARLIRCICVIHHCRRTKEAIQSRSLYLEVGQVHNKMRGRSGKDDEVNLRNDCGSYCGGCEAGGVAVRLPAQRSALHQ